MTQTIHQRRVLASRANRATDLPAPSLRREQRGKVVEWRQQAAEPRQPEPANFCAAPGEDGSKPLVSRRIQNIILALVGIAACLIARSAGAL